MDEQHHRAAEATPVAQAMPLHLTRKEKVRLIALLAGLVESNPFPESERVQELRRILAKLRADLGERPSAE